MVDGVNTSLEHLKICMSGQLQF
jgi:hypothetical protein